MEAFKIAGFYLAAFSVLINALIYKLANLI
jgi:hypothetical protein